MYHFTIDYILIDFKWLQFILFIQRESLLMESRKENKNDCERNIDELNCEKSDLTGDYKNVAVLLLMYLMQGIPMGITMVVPILLQNRGVNYKDQAAFSLAFYPFTGDLNFRWIYRFWKFCKGRSGRVLKVLDSNASQFGFIWFILVEAMQ